MAAPRRGELAGVPAGRRRCSAVWERGERKGTNEIEFWDSCSARALARRERRALQGALHGGVTVAAAGWFWKRRGAWQGKKRASARQQEGEEVVRDAWAPAHDGVMAGMAGKASASALSVASAARTEQGGGRWS